MARPVGLFSGRPSARRPTRVHPAMVCKAAPPRRGAPAGGEDGPGGRDDPFGGVPDGLGVTGGPVGDVAEAEGGAAESGGAAEDPGHRFGFDLDRAPAAAERLGVVVQVTWARSWGSVLVAWAAERWGATVTVRAAKSVTPLAPEAIPARRSVNPARSTWAARASHSPSGASPASSAGRSGGRTMSPSVWVMSKTWATPTPAVSGGACRPPLRRRSPRVPSGSSVVSPGPALRLAL